VKINQPNKVFFVGEALVGNDGVDQLVKFNQALRDYADSPNPRVIDGIVLTKFDTIDDKVFFFFSFSFLLFLLILWIFLTLGWCCNFNVLLNRSTNCIRWNWTNLYRSQKSQCKSNC